VALGRTSQPNCGQQLIALPLVQSPHHPRTPAHAQGYLTHSDLYTFFREIYGMWVAMGEYSDLVVHDVLDEILDMAAPSTPGRITLKVGGDGGGGKGGVGGRFKQGSCLGWCCRVVGCGGSLKECRIGGAAIILLSQDLRHCKMAGTVFSILANVDQFYQYNYRENFMHGGEGDGGGGGGGGGGAEQQQAAQAAEEPEPAVAG